MTRFFVLATASSLTACSAFVTRAPVGAEGNLVRSRYEGTPLAIEGQGDATPETEIAYVVKAGDTMYSLAKRHGMTVDELAKKNGITDPGALKVGLVLKLRSGAPAAAKSSVTNHAASSPTSPSRYALRWPVDGQVTSRYGARYGRDHDGIDIGAPEGTQVKAAAPGSVVFSATHGGYGNLVVVKHDNGLVTVYAHHSINLVRKGQRVEAGQTIAKVGQTGRATGPHLHFEVRKNAVPDNPLRYLPP